MMEQNIAGMLHRPQMLREICLLLLQKVELKNSVGNTNVAFTNSAQAFDTKGPSVENIEIKKSGQAVTKASLIQVTEAVDIIITFYRGCK